MPKLTQRLVESASVADRDLYLWDNEVPGFGLRIRPSGSKSYIVAFRIGGRGGQQRRRLIGKPSIISTDKARQTARLMVAQAKSGKDPIAAVIAEQRKIKLREVTAIFLAEFVDVERKPSYARECRRLFDRHILVKFGTRPLTDLTRSEIARWHHQEMRNTPFQANRCLAVLSRLMSWSARHGYRNQGAGNPCQYIEKFREPKRERYLSADELQRLAAAFEVVQHGPLPGTKLPNRRLSPSGICAIRLLLLTGARRDEIRTLRWQHVDLDRQALLLPDSKTGQRTILLSDLAVELIRQLPKHAGNPFVFAGAKTGTAIADLERPWHKIRKLAGLDDVRLHDLRHTFASIAAGAGHSLPIIGRLLGHTQATTTARYAHIAANPARQAVDEIGSLMRHHLRKRAA